MAAAKALDGERLHDPVVGAGGLRPRPSCE
jgi:hypothetical protein